MCDHVPPLAGHTVLTYNHEAWVMGHDSCSGHYTEIEKEQFYDVLRSVGVLVEITGVACEDRDRRQDEDTGSYQCESKKLVVRAHNASSMSSRASMVATAKKNIAASPGLLLA